MEALQIPGAILAGLVSMGLLFPVFFRDMDAFLEALRHWFTPDIISLFQGEWFEDQWNELKILIWILMGVGVGIGAFQLLGGFG